MSDCFAFRFYEPSDESRRSLVIFFASKVSLDAISKTIKKDVAEHLVPKNIYLLSFESGLIARQACLDDPSFVGEFNAYVGEIEQRLHCVSVSSSGLLSYCDGNPVSDGLSDRILHSGMITLFKLHSGLIVSNHGYHFTKPSGDHCDKFIRASNLLVSSVEVSFLAVAMLPHLRRDLKRIYVDTSSVAFLVSVALQLFDQFDDGMPSIESFASYAVLNEAFDFVEDRSSLLVISATTSGSLAKSLMTRTSFSKDQIVTLFHTNLPSNQIGVFDVSSALEGNLVSHRATECKFCKRGSKVIRIVGDQFVPENPKHELLVIRKDHFSKQRQSFFKQFATANVLDWNRSTSQTQDTREHFYIAVDKALGLAANPFSASLEKSIKKYISRDLATVITFDDPGSSELEEKIRAHLGPDAESITWLKPSSMDESRLNDTASVLVLVGAITSGRSLLAVSRKLRCIDASATITYLVAFSKLPNDDAYKQLEKDLTQGGHILVVLNHCAVPRIKEYTKTAWDSEQEALAPYGEDDPLGELGNSLPDALSDRRTQLMNSSAGSHQLFLPTAVGQPLALRRTFAFWSDLGFDEERLENVKQSDVYWTIQSVLHDLRNATNNKGLATAYHTTLISPANFDRYNDGVIQACLLRSAQPVELDYRVDTIFSRQMTDVISAVLTNWNNAQGEAVLEFLMALWTKRLCLSDQHIRELINLKSDDMPDVIKFILDRLDDLIGATR